MCRVLKLEKSRARYIKQKTGKYLAKRKNGFAKIRQRFKRNDRKSSVEFRLISTTRGKCTCRCFELFDAFAKLLAAKNKLCSIRRSLHARQMAEVGRWSFKDVSSTRGFLGCAAHP